MPSKSSSLISYLFHWRRRVRFATIIFTCCVLICDLSAVCSQYPGEDCDWMGSGLSSSIDDRDIRPIYLRCTQGRISWKYPRGGLRVMLKHGASGKDFKGCIRANKKFAGARIFVEGFRTLHPLFSVNDDKHVDLPRCFSSHKGQVALYVESERSKDTLAKNMAEFSYDLQAVDKEHMKDDMDECRPCSDDEMLLLYCISDFVIQGSMTGIVHNKQLDRTEISIKTSQIIRETHPVLDSPYSSEEIKYGVTQNKNDNIRNGTFHIPLKCGAQIDEGEFLFLGKVVLGNPIIKCAPRIEHWNRVRSKALKEFKNQCMLD